MHYLGELNNAQKEAVLSTDGPVLIVAGAGAGKTRTIVFRIIHLIQSGVSPNSILAITFTNKAAQEMRERTRALLHQKGLNSLPFGISEEPFVGTFHSLGALMLREHGAKIGIRKNFTILDKSDSLALIKKAMKNAGVSADQFEPRKIQSIISRNKGDLVALSDFIEFSAQNFFSKIVFSVWEGYERALQESSTLDFDDLLLRSVRLLQEHPDVLHEYKERWSHVHIDEYQDTNRAQYILSRLLVETHKNICVVGDSDQNIYSWRGANIQNMLRFEKDYPGAKIIFLEENYRSTATILSAAASTIQKNTLRIDKKLFTANGAGEKISLRVAPDESAEAFSVAQTARELIAKGVRPEDIAVLYRANFQSRALEEAFLAHGVEYQVVGVRFFERKEVKDILSYLKAALNQESLADIARVINYPTRGIGKVSIAKLFSGKKSELPEGAQQKINQFYTLLEKISGAAQTETVSELVAFVFTESGIKDALEHEGEEGKERIANIQELVALAKRYDKREKDTALNMFIEDSVLASNQDELLKDGKGVRLMTVHASKGLEFQCVFVTGLEDGLFPHTYLYDGTETLGAIEKAEEERRLFYVALTRAAKKLFLSYAERRTIFGGTEWNAPSEFLQDIDPDLIESERVEEAQLPSILLE
ncbi:MAG TPA: UvrD-helicase domain-containing protein [Candidatus Paceibacterota bacterium]